MIRLSPSLVMMAQRGATEQEIIDSYFHLTNFSNKAIERGNKFEKDFVNEVIKTHKLPQFGDVVSEPVYHDKIVCDYDDEISLSGELDLYDAHNGIIYELKSSINNSSYFFNTIQPYWYWYQKAKKGEYVSEVQVIRQDPLTKRLDRSILLEPDLERVEKAIDSNKDYIINCIQNGI